MSEANSSEAGSSAAGSSEASTPETDPAGFSREQQRQFERRQTVDLTRVERGEPERRDLFRNRRTGLDGALDESEGPGGTSD